MESKTPTWFLTVERQNRIFTVVLKAAKNLQKPHPKNVLIFIDCLFTGYYGCVSMRKSENIIRFLISASLPNYPSPNPTFCPMWEESVKCWLREGVGRQLHRNLNWSNPPTLSSRIKIWSDSQYFDEVLVLKVSYLPLLLPRRLHPLSCSDICFFSLHGPHWIQFIAVNPPAHCWFSFTHLWLFLA